MQGGIRIAEGELENTVVEGRAYFLGWAIVWKLNNQRIELKSGD
jgi:hypothetical protein